MANPLDLLAFAKRAWEQTNNEYQKTSQPLKERASVLPLGQYEDGSVGLAWPGILAAPAEGVANFGSQGFGEEAVPYNSRMAFDAAGGAMTGGIGVGLAGGMADDAVRAGKSAADDWLDLYHGTTTPTQFDKLSMKHATNRSERAIFAADVPDFANQFASDEHGRIFKIRVPRDQIMDFDMSKAYSRDPFEVAMDDAYDAGKGVVRFKTISDRPTYAIRNPDVIRYLNDPLYSNAPTGSSVPLAMNALERTAADLPMDLASRMARAREMGFDTDQVLYHGTGKTFDEFNPGTRGNGTARSIYLTDNPEIADIYANAPNYGLKGGGDPMIYPVFAKAEKPLIVSDKGPDGSFGWVSDNLAAALGVDHPPAGKYASLYDEARRQGYDQVQIREMTDLGGEQTQYIPLEARNIRSVNAAFDPSRSDSANLLAANAKSGAAVPLAMNALERAQPQIRQTHPNIFTASVGGKDAGQFYVETLPNAAVVKEAFVRPEFQRQGVGQAAYGAMQDTLGLPLTPDAQLTEAGYNFWKSAYPEAVREHRLMNNRAYEAPIPEGDVPSWRMSGGPNRPDGVAWANAPTASAIPLGIEGQEQDPALLEYLKAIGLY